MRHSQIFLACSVSAFLGITQPAFAISTAVYRDNSIDDFLNATPGFSATLVGDNDLATPGFLDAFDVFLYTRDGVSFGNGLSTGAAANVKLFVTGNVALFMTDLADTVGPLAAQGEDPIANTALLNAITFAASGGRKEYVGEFSGAAIALSNNTSVFFDGQALGLVQGTFMGFELNFTDPFEIVNSTNPVVAGLPNPLFLTNSQEFIASSSGIPLSFVVATGPAGSQEQFPTIVATSPSSNPESVPEPLTILGSGMALGVGTLMKRQHSKKLKKGGAAE